MIFKVAVLFFVMLAGADAFAFTKRNRNHSSAIYGSAATTPLSYYGTSPRRPDPFASILSSSRKADPNCPPNLTQFMGRTESQKAQRTASQIRDASQAEAAKGSPSAFSLVNKAMGQVMCPPKNIGVGAGQCGANGYRASSYDCAYYVRKALAGTLLPKGTGPLGDAKHVGCRLQEHGMKNLCKTGCSSKSYTCMMDPYAAPAGSVLIYDNVGRGCHPAGHIEIRTSNGFISDYFSTRPRNAGNKCRRLIGIWVK